MADEPPRDRRERQDPPSWKPVPDPTFLTTQALDREVAALREVIEERVTALTSTVVLHVAELREIIAEVRRYYDTVFTERDTRYEDRFAASQLAVAAAFEASEKAVASAFEAREKAIAAAFQSSEKAVAAAFESADRAISKAEISIEKRADATYVALNELQRLLAGLMPRQEAEARYANQEERLSMLGSRLDKLEAIRQGGQERTTEARQSMAGIYAAVGVVLALVAIVVPVVLVLSTRS